MYILFFLVSIRYAAKRTVSQTASANNCESDRLIDIHLFHQGTGERS